MNRMDTELAEALDTGWRLLVRGGADRRSPMHTPVVASIDIQGRPDVRVMVLRAADRASASLRFHTDARSPKCAELHGRAVSVLAYHPGEAIQLRATGAAQVVGDGEDVDRIWTQSTPFARRCYLAAAAPGTALMAPASGLPDWVEGRKPTEAELAPARANFALVMISIDAIDWLHLAQTGHRRALFRRDGNDWRGEWRVP